jgi:plasmid maintenance system killer protein
LIRSCLLPRTGTHPPAPGSRKFAGIEKVARRKLRMLEDAETLEDLAAVPGNSFQQLQASGG